MQVSMKMDVPATVKKKGKYYISCCPLIDVCSQGETQKKSLENLVDAISLFFISCFERGTLDEVLKSCGFVPSKAQIITKKALKPFPSRYKSVNVPIPFNIKKIGSTACHA